MRPEVMATAAVAMSWTLSISSAYQQPELPLIVESANVLPAEPTKGFPRRAAIRVRNASERTITAWGVRVEARLESGKIRWNEPTVDSYHAYVLRVPGHAALDPGASYVLTTGDLGSDDLGPVVSLSARPFLVVYVDGSATGDERRIQLTFDRRRADQRVWEVAEKSLADARARFDDPIAALNAADLTLRRITDEEILKSLTYQGVLRSIALAVNSQRDIDRKQALQHLVDTARASRLAAEAHTRRR